MRKVTEKLNEAYCRLLEKQYNMGYSDEVFTIEKRMHRIRQILAFCELPIFHLF